MVATTFRRSRLPAFAIVAAVVGLTLVAGAAYAQTYTTKQVTLTYQGYNPYITWEWWPHDTCAEQQPVYVDEPTTAGKYPVLLYMHSTMADWGGNVEGQRVAQLAASQGWVAAAVTYDSWLTWYTAASIDDQANCMFSSSEPTNPLAQVCAMAEANCSLGVVATGFSQGGAIAVRASNFSSAVKAAWVMGVNGPVVPQAVAVPGGSRTLPNNRLRIDDGQLDIATGPGGSNDFRALLG